MTLIVFWSAVALLIYTYLIFPLLIVLRGLLWRRPYKRADISPQVSLIVAAYNEADCIRTKIENSLSLDYPPDCLEIIIASDGSTDDTNTIVHSYVNRGIKFLELPRQGKVATLNAAVAASTGEILVFSDANSIYALDAIRKLVQPFADPDIGGVAGNQSYLKTRNISGTGMSERSYWNFDQMLKRFQSQAGNATSATGAIYAIRRSLFQPVPIGIIDDFLISTRVIAQGYRLVYAPDAIAYEPVAALKGEFSRKVRTIVLGLRAVLEVRELLNPFRHGFYALQIFSHKILRRLMFFPLIVLFLISPLIWSYGPFYQLVVAAQLIFYGFGALGLLLDQTRLGRNKIFSIPFFFCMVNYSALVAVLKLLRGSRIDRWEPTRAGSATVTATGWEGVKRSP